MARRAALLSLLALAACSRPDGRVLADGGLFEIPDSGFSFDARIDPDAGFIAPDTGPFQCTTGCPDGSVCGCIDTKPRETCGCNVRGGYTDPCDPQVPDSCRWPYECVLGRTVGGSRWLCSDGREGTPCSHAGENSCRTSSGCICLMTPIGIGCSCRGDPGPNPLLCDPQNPASCPEGRCVTVNNVNMCSSGGRNEPCNPGDGLCQTSLGCTCPLVAGRESCRCSEPGEVPGDACDPRVPGSCEAPMECTVIRGGESIGEFYTECVGGGGNMELNCDPVTQNCPPMYVCEEVRPDTWRCVIGR